MPRYFFNQLTNTGMIRDFEGSDLPNLDNAQAEALKDARSLMSDAIRNGYDISSRRIQICDESGGILLTLSFSDAVRPSN